ncbi:hypothetical protein BC829DRAFT_448119 [Chytridium lagenaria]|nr:hypothetical protein BC829DRAFT_448119 [Chytridium lagenaria]
MSRLVRTHLDDLDDERLVTSHHLSPEALRIYRAICFTYFFAFTFPSYFVDVDDPREYGEYFAYFTHFSWLGLVLYFALATYNVHVYIKNDYDVERLRRRHPIVRWIFWNSYVMNAVFHVVVPVVYWGILVKALLAEPTFGIGLFMISEFFISRVPIYYSQWTAPIFFTLLYVAYSQLTHIWLSTSAEEFWAYPFLDPRNTFDARRAGQEDGG